MRKPSALLLASTVAAGMLLTVPAQAAFLLANSDKGDGFVTASYPSFQLFGADNGVGSNITTYTDTAAAAQTLSFNWSYITHDCCGSFWDPAGYVVNGAYTQLSTNNNLATSGLLGINSSGSTTISIAAGDTFGWYVSSTDSVLGRGELDVTATIVSTPEPAAMALLGTGLLGLGLVRRRA
jgi:hypothetical protein